MPKARCRARACSTCRPSPRNGGPAMRRYGQLSYAAAVDNCCWDILGKAVGLPVYRILGALPRPRSRLRQFPASADRGGFRGRRQARHVRRLHGLQDPSAREAPERARLQARHGGHQGRPQDRRRRHAPAVRPGRRADARRSHEGGPPARRAALRLFRGRAAHQGHRWPGGVGRRPGRAGDHGRVHAVALRLRPLHPPRRAGRGPVHRG